MMPLAAIFFPSALLSLNTATAETPKIVRHLASKNNTVIFCFANNLSKGYTFLIVLC